MIQNRIVQLCKLQYATTFIWIHVNCFWCKKKNNTLLRRYKIADLSRWRLMLEWQRSIWESIVTVSILKWYWPLSPTLWQQIDAVTSQGGWWGRHSNAYKPRRLYVGHLHTPSRRVYFFTAKYVFDKILEIVCSRNDWRCTIKNSGKTYLQT